MVIMMWLRPWMLDPHWLGDIGILPWLFALDYSSAWLWLCVHIKVNSAYHHGHLFIFNHWPAIESVLGCVVNWVSLLLCQIFLQVFLNIHLVSDFNVHLAQNYVLVFVWLLLILIFLDFQSWSFVAIFTNLTHGDDVIQSRFFVRRINLREFTKTAKRTSCAFESLGWNDFTIVVRTVDRAITWAVTICNFDGGLISLILYNSWIT